MTLKRSLIAILSLAVLAPAAEARDRLVDAGWRLIQRHRMEDAARLFKEAAAKDPENAVAHRAYQTVMQCMGRHEALKDEYRDYLKAHPASGVAFYSYFSLLDNDPKAFAAVEEALKSNPTDPWVQAAARLEDATKDVYAGREEDALKRLRDASLPVFSTDARLLRASAHSELGRFDKALEEVRAAIDELPFESAYYEALAANYFEMAEFKKSLDAADQALALRPESLSALSWRSNALKMLGDMRGSEACIDKMTTITPRTTADYGAAACANCSREGPAKSKEYLGEAKSRSLYPGAQAFALLLELGEMDATKARTRCDELLRANPHQMATLYTSGVIHQQAGEWNKARAAFDAILATSPKSIAALLGRGTACRCQTPDSEKTLKAARKAFDLAPKAWETSMAVGIAYRADWEFEMAAPFLQESVRLNPDNLQGHEELASVYLVLRRAAEAEGEFDHVRRLFAVYRSTEAEAFIQALRDSARTDAISHWLPILPRPRLESLDLSAAPIDLREVVRLSTGNADHWEQYQAAVASMSATGERAAPWLKLILFGDLQGQDEQLRRTAAEQLGRLGHGDTLVDALATDLKPVRDAAQSAFSKFIQEGDRALFEKRLPAIEDLARTSLAWGARSAAMDLLAGTGDRRFAPICIANLGFSEWSAKVQQERVVPWPAGFAASVERLSSACPLLYDEPPRSRAASCLENLNNPAAIPELLKHLRRDPALSTPALRALSRVAKQYFGPVSDHSYDTARTCLTAVTTAWEIARSSDPLGADAAAVVGGLVERVDKTIADQLSGSESKVIAAWEGWWRSQEGHVPDHYEDRAILSVEFKPSKTRIGLYSSGLVRMTGPKPGTAEDYGDSVFENIQELADNLETASQNLLSGRRSELGERILKWAKVTALPRLRKAEAKRDRALMGL